MWAGAGDFEVHLLLCSVKVYYIFSCEASESGKGRLMTSNIESNQQGFMWREGKATWSNDRTILNCYHVWLGWDVRPLAHFSYDGIFDIIYNMVKYQK